MGDVCDADDDNDGLSDIDEANGGTDPNDADSDDDGLSDGDEVNEHGTDPNDTDSDDDGLSDTDEVAFGSDPNNVCDPTGDGHDGCPTSDLVIDCPPGSCDDSTSSTDFPKFWGYLYTTGTFTITNNGVGGTAPLIIEMGGSATWSVTNNGCEGLPLGPGASCTFEVVINGDPCDIPDGIDVRGSGGFWYIRIGSPLPCTDD